MTACLSPARLRSSRAAAVGGDLFGGAVRQVIFKLVGQVRRLLYGSGATGLDILLATDNPLFQGCGTRPRLGLVPQP